MVIVEKSYAVTPTGVGRRDFSKNVERYDVEPTLLLLEGFEELPPSWGSYGSAGYLADRITSYAWRGGACLRLRTGNAVADNMAGYVQEFGLPRTMRVSGDLRAQISEVARLGILFARYTGTEVVKFEVVYVVAERKWTYRDPTGHVDILNGGQSLFLGAFHHICLVADFQAEEYVYLQCNEQFMSLQGLKPYREASAEAPHSSIEAYGHSGADVSKDCFIDSVRVSEEK